ncbi:MAG: hypothetical protein ABSA52_07980 [Candidatus Binatia bacterium]|jgi:hypothetical protein
MTYRELKNRNRVWTISLLAALAAWGLPRAARATTFAELPRELQGAVRLARERALVDPAQYVVRAHEPTSATAHNPVQQLELRFGAGEVGVTSVVAEQSQWAMGLRLARYGRAGQLTPVAASAPTITGNRVDYRRGALLEWYVNEDRGVEQGFVIAARPAGKRGALALEMDVTGLRPELVDSGRVALRATHGEQVLTYGELRVTDARGRELPARLEVAKGGGDRASVRLLVDDAAAAYPVTVDPLIVSQQAELTASDGATDDNFGWSYDQTALSSDGNTALIGACSKTVSGNDLQGAAYVFVRSGTTWTQQAELTAIDGAAGDEFGISTALSSDGNTALVGADSKTVSGNDLQQGAAYVFVRSGTTWTQQAELTASDGATYDSFGASTALSSDGNTALIGAYSKTVSGNDLQGAAYVFVRSGTTWTQQAELTAIDGVAPEEFGWSAALSGDGKTALMGGPGAAYVFVRSGTTWTQQAELTASDATSVEAFGWSAALSSDGNTALIGTWGGGNGGQGAAYVFVRSGTTWTQQAELTAIDGVAGDEFGWSTALSSDGNTALIGADGKTVSGNDLQGAAYVFVRSGTTWTQQAELTASDGAAGDGFGGSAALSGDGTTALIASNTAVSPQLLSQAALSGDGTAALIGAYTKTVSGNDEQGAAYVFVLLTPTPSCAGDCNGDGQVTVDEILTMVNIALGNANISTCLAGDANHDGQITIDEILTAVNNALNGCGG